MKHSLIFWGVGGSCPGSAPGQTKYSTNTSCIEISNDEELILLDAGSGLVFLGQSHRDFSKYKRISLFLTHYHYDHIIGLPFFMPAYQSQLEFHVYGPVTEYSDAEQAIKGLFVQPYLPMGFDALQATFHFHNVLPYDIISTETAKVYTMATDHPGSNMAYRVELNNKIFSYITDLGHKEDLHNNLVAFCKNSDWIYYDANFTQVEYFHSKYEGWGHSTHIKGITLLDDSHSRKIFLGHHALHRSDADLDGLQAQFDSDKIIIAQEGTCITWEDAQ